MDRWLRVTIGSAVVAALFLFLVFPVAYANPDPCLVVYPDSPCVYHFDPGEYYTVTVGDPLYDPMYDRGGEVLIDLNTDGIAYDIYQAAYLTGFVMDAENQGYFTIDKDFDLVVDGFNNAPITFVNILLVFDNVEPEWCEPAVWVDGNPLLYSELLGWYYPIGDLVVSTPTPWGNNFSDTVLHHIMWENCLSIRIYAFSDSNYNLTRDGNECFSAYSHDTTVPVKESTWGAIKEMYAE